MTDTPGREPEERLPAVRPPAEAVPAERFTSHPSVRTTELDPERSAQIVRQSSNARWVGFLSVVVVIIFVSLYWFLELGFPFGLTQPRLGVDGTELAAQQVLSVERGYNIYEANCARCHGEHVIVEGARVGQRVWLQRVEAPHQRLASADHADRHATGNGFAVYNHIGLHAEISLRTADCEAETTENFVKNERHASISACFAQGVQPVGIGRGGGGRASHFAVKQNGIVGRRRVRMKCLHRINEYGGDLRAAQTDELEHGRIHILDRQAIIDTTFAAQARLHTIPPAVIGAGKTDDQFASGVKSRQAYRRHHRRRAAGVKRHFILARDALKRGDVVANQRMQGP